MSILKWITGGTFTDHVSKGDRFLADENYGEARLSFQRALKKPGDTAASEIESVKQKIAECARYLAMARLARARELFSLDEIEQAHETLEDVLLISDAPEVAAAVNECREAFEQAEAKASLAEDPQITEDDLLAVIAGAWSGPMAAEFADYPEPFYKALIKAHDGDIKEALALLTAAESLLDLESAQYYFLEKGRLQLASDDLAGAEASVLRFIEKIENGDDEEDEEDVEELWGAWQILANIHIGRENFAEAEKALMNSYRAAPGNHVPLLNLGMFLRERGELERAKRSLENAMDTMGAIHPDMRVFRELGLTYMAMEKKQEAIDCFKMVLNHTGNTVGHEQYDPGAAIPLAALYEQEGKLRDASDIYRHLANGYDTENLYLYNFEAARLLKAQNAAEDLVAKYLDAANALVKNDVQRTVLAQLRDSAE